MKTNEIYVSNNGEGWDDVLAETEKYANYQNLGHKQKIHIRLLAEELLGMVQSIAGSFNAYFWLEDDDESYHIHLKAQVNMDEAIREALLDTSTTGENASAKGIMGKLKDIFQLCLAGLNDTVKLASPDYYGGFKSYEMGTYGSASIWSLSSYRENLQDESNYRETENWDELEKSIIANIADDVTVGIDNDCVEMIITKNSK